MSIAIEPFDIERICELFNEYVKNPDEWMIRINDAGLQYLIGDTTIMVNDKNIDLAEGDSPGTIFGAKVVYEPKLEKNVLFCWS
jgi:hypothetical protein